MVFHIRLVESWSGYRCMCTQGNINWSTYMLICFFFVFFLTVTDILTFVNSFSPSVYGVIEGKYFYNLLATDLLINLCSFSFSHSTPVLF